jgi:hypothetical protein
MATFQASYQSDRKKTPDVLTFRHMTREEILALRSGEHPLIVLNNGRIAAVKVNGAVKTWKRDPERFEVPVKYGMYETARFDAAESLRRFVVQVNENKNPVRATKGAKRAARALVKRYGSKRRAREVAGGMIGVARTRKQREHFVKVRKAINPTGRKSWYIGTREDGSRELKRVAAGKLLHQPWISAVGPFASKAQALETQRRAMVQSEFLKPARRNPDFDSDAQKSAFELIRKHGINEALKLAEKWRDQSSPGTMSYSLHNLTAKKIREAKVSGSTFRTVGKHRAAKNPVPMFPLYIRRTSGEPWQLVGAIKHERQARDLAKLVHRQGLEVKIDRE